MMPRTCPRCGAQNGDDNAFCQQCGAPLAAPDAAAPVQPPTAQPPTPPVYQPPPPPTAPVYRPVAPAHRLPLGTMLGSVVGLLGLLAAGAIVFGHNSPSPTPPLPPAPTTIPQPTGAPVQPTAPPQPTAVAQDTPASQPTAPVVAQDTPASQPTASDVATDTPAAADTPPSEPTQSAPGPAPSGGGQTITTSLFSVVVPSGWQAKQNSATSVQLQDPSTAPNDLEIGGGTPSSPVTAAAVIQGLLAGLQKNFPDAQPCGQGQPLTIGGAQGTVLPVCFTVTPQGGAAVKSAALLWGATSSSGSSVFVVEEIAAQDNQAFFTNAGQVTKTLKWAGGQ